MTLTRWKEGDTRLYKNYRAAPAVIHCGPADGNDYVLCGAAMDGENGDDYMKQITRGKIDCLRCIAIIRHCKSIPARALKQ